MRRQQQNEQYFATHMYALNIADKKQPSKGLEGFFLCAFVCYDNPNPRGSHFFFSFAAVTTKKK